MSYKSSFNAFVSGTNGVFKGVKLTNKECIQKCIQNNGLISSENIVTAMSWGDENENDILMGCGNGADRCLKVYNTQSGIFQDSRSCTVGEGKIVGISRYDEKFLAAVQSGELFILSKNDLEETETKLSAAQNLYRMRHSVYEKNIVATGGEENPLKLYDLNKMDLIFEAKNVRHDNLELRVPVSIKDIGFLSNNNIVTVGKYGHVRLYDPKAQRRPVINLEIKDEALTNLAICPRDSSKKIIVGSGKGVMKLIDLRKPGKILNTYKGSAGGVTAIACSKTNPFVVSVGLDRFLRVHNIDTKVEIRRAYMTSKTSCMLLRSDFTLDEPEEEKDEFIFEDETELSKKDSLEDDDEKDSEYEDIFETMETVGEKRKKTIKLTKGTEKRLKPENMNQSNAPTKLRKSRK